MPIVVKISQDSMEAIIEVTLSEDESLTVDAIKHALEEAGVCHGIDENACHQLVGLVDDIPVGARARHPVAHGAPPIDGEAGNMEMAVEYKRDSVGLRDESDIVNFRDRGSFTSIEKDQLIAQIGLPTPGTPGTNVLGEEILAMSGPCAALTAGPGTRLFAGGTELRATRAGDLHCLDGRIEVTDLIRVVGNLDYEMGSIECEGSVYVEGDVLPGFHIHAGGDVSIGGVVDAADVKAGGTLVIRQGVLPGSRVFAKGEIKVGHVSGSYLESESAVTVAKEVLHSTIVSGESITLPASGRVLGGGLFARKGIEVGIAGHINCLRTILATGVKPPRSYSEIPVAGITRAKAIKPQVKRTGNALESEPQDKLDERGLSCEKTKQEPDSGELSDLITEDAEYSECYIEVRRSIHPGVRICIGSSEMEIVNEHRSAIFHYDVESGEVAGPPGFAEYLWLNLDLQPAEPVQPKPQHFFYK